MPGRNPAKLFDVVVTPKAMLAGATTDRPTRKVHRRSAVAAPPVEQDEEAGEPDWADEPF